MFRRMRRFTQQLSTEACQKVLREEWRGVLSVHGEDGYPYGFPMDFYYDEESGKIYFHTAKEGHKLDSLKKDDRVSFCVHDAGVQDDNDWALNFNSVIIFGRINLLPNDAFAQDKLRQLGYKCYPTQEEVDQAIASHTGQVQMLELTIDHMTGKRVHEK